MSLTQRPLPDNTQHSQETDIHAPGRIRTHSPASERPQTHALDRAATGIGDVNYYEGNFGHLHCQNSHVTAAITLFVNIHVIPNYVQYLSSSRFEVLTAVLKFMSSGFSLRLEFCNRCDRGLELKSALKWKLQTDTFRLHTQFITPTKCSLIFTYTCYT